MGSCTRHSLPVRVEIRERPSPSQVQRCKVILPTRQNRNLIVQYWNQFYRIEDATNDKYGDRLGENYEDSTIYHRGVAVQVTVQL